VTSTNGRVVALWRHPVKSMQGERIEQGELGASGLPFDRRWGVIDVETGKVLSAKREAKLLMGASRLAGEVPEVRLPDRDWRPFTDPALDGDLSAWLGRPVTLQAADAEAAASYQMNVDAHDADGFPEDAWIGSTVHVGDAELTVVAPTVRCVMTTRAQPDLGRDLGIVKAVNRDHESNLGVYAVVSRPGRVAVGDLVTQG